MSGRSGLISRSCQIEQAAGRTLDAALFGYLMFIFELMYHISYMHIFKYENWKVLPLLPYSLFNGFRLV